MASRARDGSIGSTGLRDGGTVSTGIEGKNKYGHPHSLGALDFVLGSFVFGVRRLEHLTDESRRLFEQGSITIPSFITTISGRGAHYHILIVP